MFFEDLSDEQRNIVAASIIADGEITKLYKNSRRRNNSYREHFSKEQLEYRKWKMKFFPDILYLRTDDTYLVSKSLPLFTKLYHHFYNEKGNKKIPSELLHYCTLPHFLAVLFLDDGSLMITKPINHRKKLIYITPHASLYLQNYPKSDLTLLQNHLNETFNLNFKLNKRRDGFGYILKLTSVEETLKLLSLTKSTISTIPSMRYKFDWEYRKNMELSKNKLLSGYTVISSDSMRFKNYTQIEIKRLITLKKAGLTHKEISTALNRPYWSIVYKLREIRKDGHL
ncbi:DNA endonuclease [Mesobacillus subterraneus]|uniref:DNA endonuclease n=1 Tax=Mesobacillus subterraneus TaxID=285983 RepID=A0A427TLG8_9BACI|nr:DNA endonuclease [Mesobacillus subterraneus]RSD25197.1 DNA endonuclease [Mesobacillus subterraneus]